MSKETVAPFGVINRSTYETSSPLTFLQTASTPGSGEPSQTDLDMVSNSATRLGSIKG